ELISKIQTMRKEAGFEVMDHILITSERNEKIAGILEAHGEVIKSEVLAEDITLGKAAGYTKEWHDSIFRQTVSGQNRLFVKLVCHTFP
ncbi:DUF5915 domain-containing protein, partial [Hungatella sp. SL.1.14]|uniref:DUF5915 domain-containing protein n=1 Tax=Hungatella sp. SL.1.14 TaxID=2963703 RepID=UPI00210B4BCB